MFGISTPPAEAWPYLEDANGDKLAEEIAKQLNWAAPSAGMPEGSPPPLTRARMSNLQRAALRGAEAIATIIDFDERSTDADLSRLISRCYTWGSALMSLGDYGMAPEPLPPAEVMPGLPAEPVFTTARPALTNRMNR